MVTDILSPWRGLRDELPSPSVTGKFNRYQETLSESFTEQVLGRSWRLAATRRVSCMCSY